MKNEQQNEEKDKQSGDDVHDPTTTQQDAATERVSDNKTKAPPARTSISEEAVFGDSAAALPRLRSSGGDHHVGDHKKTTNRIVEQDELDSIKSGASTSCNSSTFLYCNEVLPPYDDPTLFTRLNPTYQIMDYNNHPVVHDPTPANPNSSSSNDDDGVIPCEQSSSHNALDQNKKGNKASKIRNTSTIKEKKKAPMNEKKRKKDLQDSNRNDKVIRNELKVKDGKERVQEVSKKKDAPTAKVLKNGKQNLKTKTKKSTTKESASTSSKRKEPNIAIKDKTKKKLTKKSKQVEHDDDQVEAVMETLNSENDNDSYHSSNSDDDPRSIQQQKYDDVGDNDDSIYVHDRVQNMIHTTKTSFKHHPKLCFRYEHLMTELQQYASQNCSCQDDGFDDDDDENENENEHDDAKIGSDAWNAHFREIYIRQHSKDSDFYKHKIPILTANDCLETVRRHVGRLRTVLPSVQDQTSVHMELKNDGYNNNNKKKSHHQRHHHAKDHDDGLNDHYNDNVKIPSSAEAGGGNNKISAAAEIDEEMTGLYRSMILDDVNDYHDYYYRSMKSNEIVDKLIDIEGRANDLQLLQDKVQDDDTIETIRTPFGTSPNTAPVASTVESTEPDIREDKDMETKECERDTNSRYQMYAGGDDGYLRFVRQVKTLRGYISRGKEKEGMESQNTFLGRTSHNDVRSGDEQVYWQDDFPRLLNHQRGPDAACLHIQDWW